MAGWDEAIEQRTKNGVDSTGEVPGCHAAKVGFSKVLLRNDVDGEASRQPEARQDSGSTLEPRHVETPYAERAYAAASGPRQIPDGPMPVFSSELTYPTFYDAPRDDAKDRLGGPLLEIGRHYANVTKPTIIEFNKIPARGTQPD